MPQIHIYDIIHSERAKTTDHALAIIQYLRSHNASRKETVLDFSGITWMTSLFADRLVRALATFYGPTFENKIQVIGVDDTNAMFNSLWESAVDKFRHIGILAEA